MSESSAKQSITLGKVTTTLDIVIFLAEQWLKHRSEEAGISVEDALAKAEENYAAAQNENDDLKDLGHN